MLVFNAMFFHFTYKICMRYSDLICKLHMSGQSNINPDNVISYRPLNMSFVSHFDTQMCFSLVNLDHNITNKRDTWGCIYNFDTFKNYNDNASYIQFRN